MIYRPYAAQERLANEQELEANNGVVYRAQLMAVPAPEDVAASKGIRRAADKLLLPPSAGDSLLRQDASKNGAYFFELTNGTGRRTHAGLLEFTAAEGFVALPKKVVRCLWGPDADEDACQGPVNVTYRRLPKGTRAVFQPRSADFQQAVGDDLREVLEAALLQHSALSVGDWVEVRHGDRTFDLRVRELEPEAAVSVIDTELEAEVHPSVETEERIIAEEMEARRRMAEAAAATQAAAEAAAAEAAAAAELAATRRRMQEEKAAALPPEPEVGEVGAVACLFRLPDGSRHSRRFLPTQPVSLLFDYVDSKGASGRDPGSYRLVTQFPRTVFESGAEAEGTTLKEAGLDQPRSVLFLEPLTSENAV